MYSQYSIHSSRKINTEKSVCNFKSFIEFSIERGKLIFQFDHSDREINLYWNRIFNRILFLQNSLKVGHTGYLRIFQMTDFINRWVTVTWKNHSFIFYKWKSRNRVEFLWSEIFEMELIMSIFSIFIRIPLLKFSERICFFVRKNIKGIILCWESNKFKLRET